MGGTQTKTSTTFFGRFSDVFQKKKDRNFPGGIRPNPPILHTGTGLSQATTTIKAAWFVDFQKAVLTQRRRLLIVKSTRVLRLCLRVCASYRFRVVCVRFGTHYIFIYKPLYVDGIIIIIIYSVDGG